MDGGTDGHNYDMKDDTKYRKWGGLG